MTKHMKIENKTKSKKYVVVLELIEDDYYADNIDELRYEIQEMLYVGGSVRIKPLPQYKSEKRVYGGYRAKYEMGYDDCLDEILGGNDE